MCPANGSPTDLTTLLSAVFFLLLRKFQQLLFQLKNSRDKIAPSAPTSLQQPAHKVSIVVPDDDRAVTQQPLIDPVNITRADARWPAAAAVLMRDSSALDEMR